MKYTLTKSNRKNKKYMVTTADGKVIHFGGAGYDDYTTTRDEKKKKNYIARHAPREDWTRNGMNTAGFWSRWVLWNEPSIKESIKDIEERYGIKIRRT